MCIVLLLVLGRGALTEGLVVVVSIEEGLYLGLLEQLDALLVSIIVLIFETLAYYLLAEVILVRRLERGVDLPVV